MSIVLEYFIAAGLLGSWCFTANAEACESDGDVRLVDGPNELEGRVEVCLEGVWARWCHPGGRLLADMEATVICRQKGYEYRGESFGLTVPSGGFFGVGSSSAHISEVSCEGNEERITECAYNNMTLENCNDVGVVCRDLESCRPNSDSIRLNNRTGAVEVCRDGFRQSLCSEDFTAQTAAVLCRELGPTNVTSPETEDTPPYFLSFTSYCCTGNEQTFSACPHRAFGVSNGCSPVRLNCSEYNINISGVDCFGTTTTTTGAVAITSTPPEESESVLVPVVAAVVVCCVLVAIFVVVILTAVVVLLKKKRNQEETANIQGNEFIVTKENSAYAVTTSSPGNNELMAEYEEIAPVREEERTLTGTAEYLEIIPESKGKEEAILTDENIAYGLRTGAEFTGYRDYEN